MHEGISKPNQPGRANKNLLAFAVPLDTSNDPHELLARGKLTAECRDAVRISVRIEHVNAIINHAYFIAELWIELVPCAIGNSHNRRREGVHITLIRFPQ